MGSMEKEGGNDMFVSVRGIDICIIIVIIRITNNEMILMISSLR